MFQFDQDKTVLRISKIKNPVDRNFVYEKTEMYESYIRYVESGIRKDLKELLIPALNKHINERFETFVVNDIEVVRDATADYSGNVVYSVFMNWSPAGKWNAPKAKFCIFELPLMDEYGLLTRQGKEYAMIAELVHSDDVTYNAKSGLRIVTLGNRFVSLSGRPEKAKFKFTKNLSIQALTTFHALASSEGIDDRKALSTLCSREFCTLLSNSDDIELDKMVMTERNEVKSFIERLNTPEYSLVKVRDKLNRTLSIDRAVGKELSRDIDIGGFSYEKGTVITKSLLDVLKLNRVNEVYVKSIPNMDGYYLAEDIFMPVIIAGSEINDAIKYAMEIEGSFSTDEFYSVKENIFPKKMNAFIIPKGTLVEDNLLDILYYNGFKSVKLKDSATASKYEIVPFEVSIVGNRHFTERELGISNSNKYVYLTESGDVESAKEFLCAYDIVAILSLYSCLYKGEDLNCVTDLDMGLRKKVNLAYESFHRAFEKAVTEFVRLRGNVMKRKVENTPQVLLDKEEMENSFKKLENLWWHALYTDLKVIQRIEMTNPVSFYSSFNKISTIVKDKKAISASQHSISMGHYGRICPYETPSGKTMGVVGNRAMGCKIVDGIIKTSYYRIRSLQGTYMVDFSNKLWLSVEEEEAYRIADISALEFDEHGVIKNKDRVLARVPSNGDLEKMTVAYIGIDSVDLVNTDPGQTNSLTATTVPFEGADDPTRVIFGLSMCKQARGLVNPEVPIVLTSGFIDIPRRSPYYMIQAEDYGYVDEVDGSSIRMVYDSLGEKVYEFKSHEFHSDAVIIRNTVVSPGDKVKPGDLLLQSNFTKDGYLATGVNCLTGFVPTGSNYEDGVCASERLSYKLTSYGPAVESWSLPSKMKGCRLRNVNKYTYRLKDTTACSVFIGKNKTDMRLKSHKIKGFVIDSEIQRDKYSPKRREVVLKSLSLNTLKQGDKAANRHGNKGVDSFIIKNTDMPQFQNGEFLDLCLNPIGAPSRMNIGQIIECNLGLCGHILGIHIQSDSFNGAAISDVKLLLKFTHQLANTEEYELVLSSYPEFEESFKEHCRKNMYSIQNWKNCFNEDGTAWLFNPRTGKMFESPVLVGSMYEYKLYHEVEKKEHARAGLLTEPYVEKFDAPPKGASNRGGQRFGYMEMDALSAYGASALISELKNERGDNAVARNNLTVSKVHKGDSYMLDPSTGIRRSVEYFVNLMEAMGVVIDFEGELPNNTKEICLCRQVYKSKEIITAKNTTEGSANEGTISSISDGLCDIVE